MSEVITFLAAPFAMTLILVGIHCYLGIHVLNRGVVFIDLALAQVAVLGSILPTLLWDAPSEIAEYASSIVLTLLCSAFLTLSNQFKASISQEAIIGVVYAFASALAMLLFHSMPHGHEHLTHTLSGQILFCSWSDVTKVFCIYALVSTVYWLRREAFLKSSTEGTSRPWDDFLFYALFGIIISSSVRVAGILIVFIFLIVPALLSHIWFQSIRYRLLFGWIFGAIFSVLSMALSYRLDWPTGPTFVLLFSLPALATIPFLAISRFTSKGVDLN